MLCRCKGGGVIAKRNVHSKYQKSVPSAAKAHMLRTVVRIVSDAISLLVLVQKSKGGALGQHVKRIHRQNALFAASQHHRVPNAWRLVLVL